MLRRKLVSCSRKNVFNWSSISFTLQHNRPISSRFSATPVTRLLNFPCEISSMTSFIFPIGASQRFTSHCPHADTATPTTRKASMGASIPCSMKSYRRMASTPKENDHSSAENLNCKDEFIIAEPPFLQKIDQHPGGSGNRI